MDSNKENQDAGFNGTIYHEGFKFHRKYVGKKNATYWCCHNRVKNSDCNAKLKINLGGKVISTEGDHHVSCYYKQADTRRALGYVQPTDPEDQDFESPPDLREMMLKRAEEIALNDISMAPKKVHLMVLRPQTKRLLTRCEMRALILTATMSTGPSRPTQWQG